MKPSEEYTIKILSPEDYERLPYNGADDSFGMSVMKTKTAYIKSTGVKDMDIGTINHEFDELMSQTSDHEIDGIRYKKFKDFFRAVLPMVFGPLAGPADSLLFGASDKRKQEKQQSEFNNMFSQNQSAYQPSQSSQAFAPQQTAQPLGQSDFQSTLAKFDKNASLRRGGVFETFRGLGTPQSNTAFNRNLTDTTKSSALDKESFLEDQRKLGSVFA